MDTTTNTFMQMCFGCSEEQSVETVLLSSHNIRIIFNYILIDLEAYQASLVLHFQGVTQ